MNGQSRRDTTPSKCLRARQLSARWLLVMVLGGGIVWPLAADLAVAAATGEEPTRAEEIAFRAAVDRVAGAVVRIEPAGGFEPAAAAGEVTPGSGPSTGLVIDGAGWILTTAFAVPPETKDVVVVRQDGTRMAARAIGRDLPRGLVLLKSEPLPDIPVLETAARGELVPGQWTIAVGCGWSHETPSVSVGILSAVNRAWGRGVQTDAAVSPANYGGPLVDIAGRLIGILAPLPADTAGMTAGTELYDAGIGFAVPLEDVFRVLPRLKRGESAASGILGISYRSRDLINGEPVIASCRQGSPAARAGLRPGDRIVAIEDAPVARIADARQQILPRYAGDEIEVEVERPGIAGRRTVRATLVDRLPPWRRAVVGAIVAPGAAGEEGLRVRWLLPGGPAARAGIAVGDVVESVAVPTSGAPEPLPIDSAASLAGILAGIEPGGSVTLGIRSAGQQQRALDVVTAAAPEQLPAAWPADLPPAAQAADGPPEATAVVTLAAAEGGTPAVAILPAAATDRPLGALVYFGPPQGPVAESEALVWKAAAERHHVAVIMPGSDDPQRWRKDDARGVLRALAAVQAKRPIDVTRIAVTGRAAGGEFAWLVAERLGPLVRGVALLDAALPRQATITPAEPGRSRWILLGQGREPAAGGPAGDRQRLEDAGYPVGTLPAAEKDAVPADTLCGWVSLLGLL